MTEPKPKPPPAGGQSAPSKLRLAFSKAADTGRIGVLFSPKVKARIDPHNFVVKRDKTVFDHTVANGNAAFLCDNDTGEVHTLSMAYHVHDPAQTKTHKHTEIGTSITRLAGYKSAQLVIAALALKEWWQSAPSDLIVTEIMPGNKPSLNVYRDHLGWSAVKDAATARELHDLCNDYIAPADKGRPTLWFSCASHALPRMASILLRYMNDPAIRNKTTGHSIDLDLSALEKAGLSRQRLRAIAKGITDKNLLRNLNRPSQGPTPNP